MTRTMSVPCRRDLACYRDDGHPGDCAYPTPETVPQPAMTPRTPTTAALHEEHTCRDCGAVITLPYARPPKHIGWAVPDPAPLDVERLYDALAHWYDGADGGESFRLVPMSSDGGVMPTGDLHPFAAAIAREYAKDPQS
jgi:hypothetical protein